MNAIRHTWLIPALTLCLILTTTLLFTACVREYPEEGKEVDPTEILLTLELSTAPAISSSPVSDYVYFIIELYEDQADPEPVFHYGTGAARNSSGTAGISVSTSLHAGEYTLAAFAVSCNDSTGDDSAYKLSDLRNITFKGGEYPGPTPLKQCYSLTTTIDLPYEVWFASDTLREELTAPVGKVEVISEDAAEFVRTYISGLSSVPALSDENMDNYGLRWSYDLYCPVGFNAVTGSPNKSETGVGFVTDLTPLNDEEILLGYDYIFVNGDATTVNFSLNLYDKTTGETLNTYGGIEAEIFKGETTTLRGNFLTVDREPGVNIDTEFDGDININI